MKSSPCSNHLSSVSFMRKWFLLLASVPFSPVLFSLHFCESGDRALKCKGFLFSGKYGETLCCALVTKNNSPASVKPLPDRKESLSAKVSTKNEWQQQQQQQRLWHRRKRSTPFPKAGQAGRTHSETQTMQLLIRTLSNGQRHHLDASIALREITISRDHSTWVYKQLFISTCRYK